jgi:hypothetical protein
LNAATFNDILLDFMKQTEDVVYELDQPTEGYDLGV